MKLLVMSFDGDTKLESPIFNTVESAWEYSSDIGSKWYFYPFHFAVTDSGKTIKDVPSKVWEWMKGMRVDTVSKRLSQLTTMEEAQGMDAEEYIYFINDNF